MTPLELHIYQAEHSLEFNTYWIPCTWFIHQLTQARQSNRISDPQGLKIIMEVSEAAGGGGGGSS